MFILLVRQWLKLVGDIISSKICQYAAFLETANIIWLPKKKSLWTSRLLKRIAKMNSVISVCNYFRWGFANY